MRKTLKLRKGRVLCHDYDAHVSAMRDFKLAPFVPKDQDIPFEDWEPTKRVQLAVRQSIYKFEWSESDLKRLCFAFSCLQDATGFIPEDLLRKEYRELKTSPAFSRHLGKRWRAFWDNVTFQHVIVIMIMGRLDRQGLRKCVPRAIAIPDPSKRRVLLEWWRRLDYPRLTQGETDVLSKTGIKGGRVQTKNVATLEKILAIIAGKSHVLDQDLKGPVRMQNDYDTIVSALTLLRDDLREHGDVEGEIVLKQVLDSRDFFKMQDFYKKYVEKPSLFTSIGRVGLASERLSQALEDFLKQDSSLSWSDLLAFVAGLGAVATATTTAGRLCAIVQMSLYGYHRYPVIARFISQHLAANSAAKVFLQDDVNPSAILLAFFPFLKVVWDLLFGKFEISQMWESFSKSSSQVVGIEKTVYGVLTQLIRLLPERVGAVLKVLRSPAFNELEKLHDDMDGFRFPDKGDGTIVIGWFTDEAYTKQCAGAYDDVASAAFDFYNRMSGLQHRLSLCVRASPVMQNLTSAVSFLRECALVAARRNEINIERPQTAWIHLVGRPNSGKSDLQEQLVSDFVRVFRPGHQVSDVSHQGEDNFLDSYKGELVEKRDDLFQGNAIDKRTEIALHIIRAVAPGVYLPYMADPAKKGQPYKAHMLVSTSNQLNMGAEAGFALEDITALQRRRMINAYVEIDRQAAAETRKRTAMGQKVDLDPRNMVITLRHVMGNQHDVYTCNAGEFFAIVRLALLSYPSLTHTGQNFVSSAGGTPSPVFGALFYCTHYDAEIEREFTVAWLTEEPTPERVLSYMKSAQRQSIVLPAGAHADWFRVVGECNDLARAASCATYEEAFEELKRVAELAKEGVMYTYLGVEREGLDDEVQQRILESLVPSTNSSLRLQGEGENEASRCVVFDVEMEAEEIVEDGSFLLVPLGSLRAADSEWSQRLTSAFYTCDELECWMSLTGNIHNNVTRRALAHLSPAPGVPLRYTRVLIDALKSVGSKCNSLVGVLKTWVQKLLSNPLLQGVVQFATYFTLGAAGVTVIAGIVHVIVKLLTIPFHLLTQKPPGPGAGGTAFYSSIFGVNQCGLGVRVYAFAKPGDEPWGLWVPQADVAVREVYKHYYPGGRFWEDEGSYAWFGSVSNTDYEVLGAHRTETTPDLQSVNLKIRDVRPARHGHRKAQPKVRSKVQGFSPKFVNNSFYIVQEGMAGKCFMVSDKRGLTNTHSNLKDGNAVLLSLDRRATFDVVVRVRNSTEQGDLCVFTTDKPVPGVKKLENKFVDQATLRRGLAMQANCFRQAGNMWVPVFKLEPVQVRVMEDPRGQPVRFSVGMGLSAIPSNSGECGLPYVFADDSLGVSGLCGIHVAGSVDKRVHFIPVTTELLTREFALLEHTPTMQSIPASRREDVEYVQVAPEARPRSATKTGLVQTPFYDEVVKEFGERVRPARLRTFVQDGQVLSPLYKAEDKLRFDLENSSLPMPSGEIVQLLEALYPTYQVATDLVVACRGGEGVSCGLRYKMDPLDLNTSAGWPLMLLGKKKRDFVDGDGLPDVDKLLEAYAQVRERPGVIEIMSLADPEDRYGQFVRDPTILNWMLIPPVYVGTLKDEKRDKERVRLGKTRMFYSPSMQYVYLGRYCFGAYVALCKEHFASTGDACGINPVSLDWQVLYDNFIVPDCDGEWQLVAGDYSSYDANVPYAVCEAVTEFLLKCGSAPERTVYLKMLLGPRITIVDDRCYAIKGGNPSGQYLTAPFNGMTNKALLYSCYRYYFPEGSVEAFLVDNRLLTGGDDHVWAQRKVIDINMVDVSVFMLEQFGITYTDTTKSKISRDFVPVDEVTFLKRRWRRDNQHPGLLWPELEEESVIAALTYMHKGAPFGNVLDSVLHEVALFDESRYRAWMARLRAWDDRCGGFMTPRQRAGYREAIRQALRGEKEPVFGLLSSTSDSS